MKWGLVLFVCAGIGCTVEPLEFGGLACPCDQGWTCTPWDRCVEGGEEGLLAYYPFDDDPSDGSSPDLSGGEHPAVCEVCPTAIDGVRRGAIELDGTSGMRVVDDGTLQTAEGFTVSVFAWTEQPTRSALVNKPLGTEASSYRFGIDAAGRVRFAVADVDTQTEVMSDIGVITSGRWHHVAGRWEAGRMVLFVDGAEVAAADASVAFDNEPIDIGGDPQSSESAFIGRIDELRLYDRALSEDQVRALSMTQ